SAASEEELWAPAPGLCSQEMSGSVLGSACSVRTRDKSGRAVAIITTRNTAWLNPHCNTTELVRLLLYLHSIPRPECQALGLTVLVDARRCSPVPALFKAFSILQVSLELGQRSTSWLAILVACYISICCFCLHLPPGMRHLACISMEDCSSAEHCAGVIKCLESYKGQHPDISDARFQEMKELACELKSDKGLKQWKFAWSKCQETKLVFEKKLEAALRTRRSLLSDRKPAAGEQPRASSEAGSLSHRRHSEGATSGLSVSYCSKLRHIIDEMVTTEREYVRSLCYIIDSYFPEMERLDLPQDLRGKRSVIFGNLEKLYDFHSQYFLRELESCCNHPLRVSHCFLRHKDQFGMYALYSKNKPKSDSLLASHGNTFFKFKQVQLGDKMDLASYLLKPIQRMSKYALLLKDLIKECSEAQEQELAYLRAAEEMVKFQLRHGNDLLAMDAIRDCDVNLKEQGQLVRQDEFTIWLGRRKCQRHVFLFEDLILFSKPKRIEGGFDVYIYKRSFKTADIGLTENSGDSGLRFEIWFRRRKSSDTYILQASSAETKQAWTSDIAKILWQQAARNKEIRMQEMVSMGVGNKPFLDIKPSEAAINDRAIDYIMKGRGARTRASIAVSLFDHSNPYKRTQAQLCAGSTPAAYSPSSSSLLGPLNLHMYLDQALLPGVLAPSRPFDIGTCIEEDELEHETSSQPSLSTYGLIPTPCSALCGQARLTGIAAVPVSYPDWGREGPVLPCQLCLSFHSRSLAQMR
uniref:Puratrophin-1 n=1 Tax=Bubo bubo TaxID=30461 RepID=A0A8C0EYA4_BUBBB